MFSMQRATIGFSFICLIFVDEMLVWKAILSPAQIQLMLRAVTCPPALVASTITALSPSF